MDTTIRIIRGDTLLLSVEATDDDEPIDLTGNTFFFTIKRRLTDDDDDAILAKDWDEHTDPEEGLTELELSPEDTDITPGTYYYDIQLLTSANEVISTEHGMLEVIDDVTKRNTAS